MRRVLTPLLSAVAMLSAVPVFAQGEAMPPPPVPPSGPAAPVRPEGNTLGIGAGFTFPQSILEPNTVGVRLRVGPVALEPGLRLGGNGTGTANKQTFTLPGQQPNVNDNQDKASGFDLSLGVNVRYAIASHGPVDLIVIGGAGFSMGTDSSQNDVTNTTTKDTTNIQSMSASVGYGLGIEWFVGHGLSVGADATNPLLVWTQSSSRHSVAVTNTTTNEVTTTVTDTNQSNVTGALVWAPTVRLMVFLYF